MTRQLVTRTHSRPIELSIVGEDLPSEFRIFRAGWNDTEKGSVLFDAEAANSVMASAAKWGVDFMIDLEHQAVTSATPPEPTARDARGWFRVELRAGELWAVNVKWTEDGAARLLSKRQRYISPAFSYDPETSRVLSLLNVAIVAMPATHEAQPLMAASIGECMDPELLKQAMDALIAGDAEKCMEILKGIITSAAGGEEAAEAEAPPADPAAEMSAEAPPPADEKKEEVAAASARLLRLTNRTTFGGALDEVETWRQSHMKLEAREAELAKEKAALELGKRKENAATLTKLGAETPHTTGLAKGKLCKRLLDEPLDEQNERIAALLQARGGNLNNAINPPPSGGASGQLSQREIAKLKAKNIDPEKYLKVKASMGGN